MNTKIPTPSLTRLCLIYQACEDLYLKGQATVSSIELARILDSSSANVRKDINYLGEIGNSRAGYEVMKLKNFIAANLNLTQKRKTCIVGLGRLGSAILAYEGRLSAGGYRVVAGFDASINRLETIRATVPLYPDYEMTDVVRQEQIELAIVTVPGEAAQKVTDQLVEGGVKGIINFTPVVVKSQKAGVRVRNIDVVNELRVLTSMMTTEQGDEKMKCATETQRHREEKNR